jgi:hypothetical protein
LQSLTFATAGGPAT